MWLGVGFAEAILLTTWTPHTTPGVRHRNPEAVLLPKTTFGLTLPFLAAHPFMVGGRGLSGMVPLPLCLLPIPWAHSEVGQDPIWSLGPGSRLPLHLHPLLLHPSTLQNPRLRQTLLSSTAGKTRNEALLNAASNNSLVHLGCGI